LAPVAAAGMGRSGLGYALLSSGVLVDSLLLSAEMLQPVMVMAATDMLRKLPRRMNSRLFMFFSSRELFGFIYLHGAGSLVFFLRMLL
jgi:hypothetical protein